MDRYGCRNLSARRPRRAYRITYYNGHEIVVQETLIYRIGCTASLGIVLQTDSGLLFLTDVLQIALIPLQR